MVVSLSPPAPKYNVVSLDANFEKRYTDESLEAQADRAAYALADQFPNERVKSDFWLGHEKRLRDLAFAQESVAERKRKLGLVQHVSAKAASENRPISVIERDILLNLSKEELDADPNSIIEKLYARRQTEEFMKANISDVVAVEEDTPEVVPVIRSALEDIQAKQQIAQTVLAEVQKKYEDSSLLEKVGNFAVQLIPLYTWAHQHNAIAGSGSNIMTGSNIEEQSRSLYLTPSLVEFERKLRTAVNELSESNLMEAVQFASSMVSYTGTDALWDNIFFGLDAIDVGVTGAAVAGARLMKKGKSAVKATAIPGGTSERARKVIQGDIAGAARVKAKSRLDQISGATPHKGLRELTGSGPGLLDPKSYTRDAGSLSNERAARLEEELSRNTELLVSTMTDFSHIGRIGDEAAEVGFTLAEKAFRQTYRNLEDSVVDVRHVRESEDVFGGVDHIEVLVGKKDATGFNSEQNAKYFAEKQYRLPEGSYSIVADSGNFFIRMTKTIDETDLRVTDLRIPTQNKTPVSLATTILGGLRSNTYLVSPEHGAWRKVATYGGQGVLARLSEIAKPFEALGKNEYTRLKEFMDVERIRLSGKGAEFRTVGEFEKGWMEKFGNLPSDNETRAWFTYKQVLDFDHIHRNISTYRDKARLGVEQVSVGYSRSTETGGKPRWNYVNSDFFEGRTIQSLPSPQEAYTVGWVDPENGRWHFSISNRIGLPDRGSWDAVQEGLSKGDYKVIQVFNPRDEAVRGMLGEKLVAGEPVQYMIVKNTKTKPLSFEQVPYNPDQAYHDTSGFYIRQAKSHRTKFNRRIIDGDVVVQRAISGAEGKEALESWEAARQMLRKIVMEGTDDYTRLSDFISRRLPVSSVEELVSHFRLPGVDNPDAVFDLDTPFVLAEAGKKSGDVVPYGSMFSDEFVDLNASTHTLGNRVITNRVSSNNLGTQQNPVFGVNPAASIDPMETIRRSAERIARSRYYDDYVHRSVEDWLTEFNDTMGVPRAELMANPLKAIQNPQFMKDFPDKGKLKAAKESRRAILELLGRDSLDQTALKYVRQKVLDGIYKAHGQRASAIADTWLWDEKADPSSILRAGVFHFKLGLFNPVQLPLQGMASLHAMAIDGNPVRAMQSVFGYSFLRQKDLMQGNTKASKMLTERMANALGVKSDTLNEMYDTWKASGMDRISGEYSQLDDILNPKLFVSPTTGRKAMDAGTFFFKEGNNIHRGTSFALSFLRWRKENPEALINNKALQQIVDRADTLYINMARDSNAQWQRGPISIPSQFFAFQARVMEQLWGGKLTGAEKARLLAVNSALWGIPVGAAGPLVGALWPVHESVQQYMLENGIDGDASIITKTLTEGILDMGVEIATGRDMNVNERFGPGGLSWFKDILEGDGYDVLTGASGSWVGDMLGSLSPFGTALVSVFDSESDFYQPTKEDILAVFKNVSSVNNTVRAMEVYNLGEWLTRNGQLVKKEDKGDFMSAVLSAVGLTPDEIIETYSKMTSNKQFDAARRQVTAEVGIDFRRALKFAQSGDRENADVYFRRAHIRMQLAGLNPIERGEIFRNLVGQYRSLIDTIGWDFVIRDPEKRLQHHIRQVQESR